MSYIPQNYCLICYESVETNNLKCGHIFCSNCLKKQLELEISNRNINLSCPQCQTQYHGDELASLIGQEECEQIFQAMIKFNQINLLKDDETMIDCVNMNCSNKIVIWKEADYYSCNDCQKKFCLLCKSNFHQNMTCAEAKMQLSEEELLQLKNLKEMGFRKCPHCQVLVDMSDGCYFIACQSQMCRGRKFFCFRCEVKLEEQDHWNHYEMANPFEGNCKIKENGSWVSNTSQKVAKVNSPNDFPCPKCGTYDAKLCKKQENFNNAVCECKSDQCKGSYYCLKCKKKVEEKQFGKHFNESFECVGRICSVQ